MAVVPNVSLWVGRTRDFVADTIQDGQSPQKRNARIEVRKAATTIAMAAADDRGTSCFPKATSKRSPTRSGIPTPALPG